MFSSSFSQHNFAINVSLSFVRFKVLGSRFVSLSISILSDGQLSFAPLKIPKENRFPGHGVLLNNSRKLKRLNFFQVNLSGLRGGKEWPDMNTQSMFFSFKGGGERTSRVAALENAIISQFTFDENGSWIILRSFLCPADSHVLTSDEGSLNCYFWLKQLSHCSAS